MPLASEIKTTGTRKQNFESRGTQLHSKHRASRSGKGRKGSARFEVWMFIFINLLSLVDQTAAFLKPLEPRINFESKTFTACSYPLTECPRSDKQKLGRKSCMFGHTNDECPNGTYYGCGMDEKTGFLVEDCFEKHLCPAGSSNRIRLNLDTKKTFLECSGCDKDHFQPYTADSSVETFTGCQEERSSVTLENEMYTMILIEEGWPTRPDKYSCNVALNYSDANQHMYCFVNRPCHCDQDFCCDPSTPDLLPNRSCDAKCAVDRLPLQNYSCPRYLDRGQPQEPDSADNFTTEEPSSESTEIPTLWIVLTFVVVVLAVGVAGFCCFMQYRRRRPRERRDELPHEDGNVEEILVGRANDENGTGLPRNDQRNSAESGDEVSMLDNPVENNRNENENPDERYAPRGENPITYQVPQQIIQTRTQTKTQATHQIIIERGKNVNLYFHEQRNDQNPFEDPSPVRIAAEPSNGNLTLEESNLKTPIQEESCGLGKKSYSDNSLPLMDADIDEDRKHMVISDETELKLLVRSDETKPKIMLRNKETNSKLRLSSDEILLQELKEVESETMI